MIRQSRDLRLRRLGSIVEKLVAFADSFCVGSFAESLRSGSDLGSWTVCRRCQAGERRSGYSCRRITARRRIGMVLNRLLQGKYFFQFIQDRRNGTKICLQQIAGGFPQALAELRVPQ